MYGGKTDLEAKFIELTIVKDIKEDDVLMQEEVIFSFPFPVFIAECLFCQSSALLF